MNGNSSVECSGTAAVLSSVLPPLITIEFLLGLPGIILALWIFGCQMPVSTPTTMYLLNLVVADFLLILGLPFQIEYFLRCDLWKHTVAMCRTNLFMLTVNRSASIAFMSIITVDRYFKVVHPHHRFNYITAKQARLVVAVAWVVVVSLRLPLLSNDVMWQENNKTVCQSFGKEGPLSAGIKMHYALYLGEFFLPFVVLIFCTGRITCILRQRRLDRKKNVRKAMKVVLAIMTVFISCFMPSFVASLCALGFDKYKKEAFYEKVVIFFRMSVTFTYLNSALDPIIYCFSSSSFRNVIRKSCLTLGLCQMQLRRTKMVQ